jgi:hypothetical protein
MLPPLLISALLLLLLLLLLAAACTGRLHVQGQGATRAIFLPADHGEACSSKCLIMTRMAICLQHWIVAAAAPAAMRAAIVVSSFCKTA